MGTPSLAFLWPSHLLLQQGCIYNIRPCLHLMSKVWITLLYCAVYWTSIAIHANAGEYIFGFNTMASIIVSVRYNTQYMQCGYDQCDVQLFPPNRCSAQIWDSEEAVSVLYMTWNLLVLPNSANPRCDATHYSWNSYGMPYCTYYSHLYICGAVRHITCGLPWARFTMIPSITHQKWVVPKVWYHTLFTE